MKEGLDSSAEARVGRARRGSRAVVVGGEVREMAEALREGGPRKREGGGARSGCLVAEEGESVDMVESSDRMSISVAGASLSVIKGKTMGQTQGSLAPSPLARTPLA